MHVGRQISPYFRSGPFSLLPVYYQPRQIAPKIAEKYRPWSAAAGCETSIERARKGMRPEAGA
eukprot:238780-Prymnesium_polylepis.1